MATLKLSRCSPGASRSTSTITSPSAGKRKRLSVQEEPYNRSLLHPIIHLEKGRITTLYEIRSVRSDAVGSSLLPGDDFRTIHFCPGRTQHY
jgi:hypothetical protein